MSICESKHDQIGVEFFQFIKPLITSKSGVIHQEIRVD